jgi:hypothetical protein
MCYPKPGPRCSAHAKAKYVSLLQKQKAARDSNSLTWEQSQHLKTAVNAAELDYDSTPVGQARLELRIKQGMSRDGDIEERLENARALRAMQLQAVKAEDAGDVHNHEDANLEWTRGDFLSKRAHRKDWKSEKSQKSVKKYIEYNQAFIQKLSTEESMALYWHTSDGSVVVNSEIHGKIKTSSEKWTYANNTNHALSKKYSKTMIQNQMKTLDGIFAKHSLNEPTVLYRGIGSNGFPKELTGKDEDSPELAAYLAEKYPVGKEVVIPEYMSASADPAVAHNFSGFQSVVLEVKTKSAVPVGLVSAWNASEREFLVNRDGKYKVVSVLKDVTYKNVFNSYAPSPDNEHVTVIQLEEV